MMLLFVMNSMDQREERYLMGIIRDITQGSIPVPNNGGASHGVLMKECISAIN